MASADLRIGLIGAGYIADWHADAIGSVPGARLAAVCDVALPAAQALAGARGVPAFGSVEAMIGAGVCDAVHVLTPPHLHRDLAVQCLRAGLHVLVEKPFALDRAQCLEIAGAAREAGRAVAVNHNFLGLPAYERLKAELARGSVGRLDAVDIRWRFPLPPLRSGPFGLWMLRAPENLLLELGPHLFAFATDLCGPLSDVRLSVGRPVRLPGGVEHFQSWRIEARAGATEVSLHLSLVEGADDRSVTLRGATGIARLDYAADALTLERANASDIVVSPLRRELSLAGQHLREGVRNAARQLVSLNRRSPYALGFRGAIAAFAEAARTGRPVDPRFSAEAAAEVTGAIGTALAQLPAPAPAPAPPALPPLRPDAPLALVTGGTGFIGRALVHALAASGRRVRVLSRGAANPFDGLGDRVEMFSARLDDPEALRAAMAGVDVAYHLARAVEASWEGCLARDVAPTVALAEAALSEGVRRFVYTGTIDSYDASRPERPIDEATGFEADMTGRNLYARSKAECEARLEALRRERGLPLVVARPGIVLGAGGPLQHWGIGRWNGPGAVRIWGDGRNVLPLVLVEDVADALVAMAEVEGIEGESFNLIGEPMLSARGYFEAIREATGSRIEVAPGAIWAFFAASWAKYALKRFVLRRGGLARPTWRDWKSRTQASPFRNEKAKRVLGWRPETDRAAFVRRAVTDADLLGF